MVRRGFAPTVLRMRIASIITATPAALSVAPVDECQLSRCAPISTISLADRSRKLGDDVHPVHVGLVVELRLDLDLHLHRHAAVEHADQPVVVLDRERDLRRHLARVLVARAAGLDEDRAAIDACVIGERFSLPPIATID